MLRRSSRRSSEDFSSAKKRTSRREPTPSPRRGSSEKGNISLSSNSYIASRKRDDKRDDKKDVRETRHRSDKSQHAENVEKSHMLTDAAKEEGDFSNFPQITSKSVEGLKKRGIAHLFPVQYMSFNELYNREDMMVRDLTGSGKTLGFSLPLVEYLRNKLFGTRRP
jgi:ATP-dependent RNA helicase DDX21